MRNLLWASPLIFFGMQICASADTILPGTQIQVRTDQPVMMHIWDPGRIYPARVAKDVFARNGDLAIPRGSYAELIVREIGPNQMALDLESVTVNGMRYVMDTSGPQFNMPNGEYNNGAGLIGSVIGAISGNNVQVETEGNGIRVPDNAAITYQLQEPMHVAGWNDPGYTRDGEHYHHEGDWYR
ncbi:MAG TPA: hypothetical protein VME17_04725 [Bryobacteraceae bacterium]|nr:hypothetical protein [Bryobacteraceae bacterium]